MGILTDYDASAAFDRDLHTITIITCRLLGLPLSACMFLYNLLHQMEFHLITGLGASKNHSITMQTQTTQVRECFKVAVPLHQSIT
jgi:hypothetical protein